MSFDQRRNRITRSGITTPVQAARSSKPEPEGRSPVLVLAGIAAGLIFVALAYSGYVSGMRQIGKQIDEKFEAQIDQTISPTPQLALLKTAAADDWSLGNCTMKKPPSAIDQFHQGEYAGRDKQLGNSLYGDMSVGLVNEAEFLACVAGYEAERLCKPEIRAAFATDVIGFYHEHTALKRFVAQNPPLNIPTIDEAMAQAAEGVSGEMMSSNVNATIDQEMSDTKDKADTALQEAISNGYVSESDFGWMTPTQVHDVFKRSKVENAACQKKQ